jgi:hypothetical protein
MFGEMLRDLKVRLSTNSYILSNKSTKGVNKKVAAHASGSSHVPRTLFSSVFRMIGMIISCTCARISGEESIDETICGIVNALVTDFLPITHRAEGLCDAHRGVRLVIFVSIHQSFQVITLRYALFARNRLPQQAVVRFALSLVRNGHSSRRKWYTRGEQ